MTCMGYQGGAAGALKRDAGSMMRSGDYYVTPELCRHLGRLEDAVDHIRLDQDFLRTSGAWNQRFDQRALADEQLGADSAAHRGTGRMSEVKKHMAGHNVANMMDNQVREVHHWAANNLGHINQDLGAYSQQSKERIRQFCDEVGVTDRYTGYRNNLNRGSRDPVRLGYQWLDTAPNQLNRSLNVGWRPSPPPVSQSAATMGLPPTYAVTQPTGALPPTALSAPPSRPFTTKQTTGTIPCLTVKHSGSTMQRLPPTASIQEQCGINTRFPGHTEYMTRYQRPELDRPTRAFTINPTPDFSIYGRPLMRQTFTPNNTEYQARYEWPDGSRITKLPWRKN